MSEEVLQIAEKRREAKGTGDKERYTHLNAEVKWALGNITTNKANGGDRIPVGLFQILKDDAVKVLYSIDSKFGKLSRGHRAGKGQFSFQSQSKTMPKNVQTTSNCTHLIH